MSIVVSIGLSGLGPDGALASGEHLAHRGMVGLLIGLENRLRVLPATQFAQVLERSVLQRRGESPAQTVPPEAGFVRDAR